MQLRLKQGKTKWLFFCVFSFLMLAIGCSQHEALENPESDETDIQYSLIGSGFTNETTIGGGTLEFVYRHSDTGYIYGTDLCKPGPGYCGEASTVPWLAAGEDPDFANGDDFIGSVAIDAADGTVLLKIVQIREGWFNEGGYLDGTFTASELELNAELTEALDAEVITLQAGIYNMTQDQTSGTYSIVIDAIIE